MTAPDWVTRRSFLSRLWKIGSALIGFAGVWTSWDILRPPASAGASGPVRTIPPAAVPQTGVVEIQAMRGYLTREGDTVIALSWKCPHLGCRVPWCESSMEFECPCHGSVFNRVGEYREGPAPRGMDRLATSEDGGVILVEPTQITAGPPPGAETINEPPAGPRCIGGS